ncbi:MAG: DUF484 family protein [Xanthomonadaceae bacterium]|nr:DUF484 family protein [Xanthomonadaceae bacterium]
MSTQRKRGVVDPGLDDAAVVEYLQLHPEFFESNVDLFARMRIPHPAGGAVSLVERQLAILRQQNRQVERKLVDLVEVARANDQLMERMHKLTVALFEAGDVEQVVQAVFEQLRDGFGADDVTLFAFDPAVPPPARTMSREAPELTEFRNFLQGDRPVLGKLKAEQLEILFGDRAGTIASAVLIPLGARAEHGMLGIGSRRPEQFNPTMGTVYLARMGALIGLALTRCRG